MKENAVPKGSKDAAKSGANNFQRQDMKVVLIVIKKTLVDFSGNVDDVDTSISLKWKQQIQLGKISLFNRMVSPTK